MQRTSSADNVHVQMGQPGGNGKCHHYHAVHIYGTRRKEIEQ